MFIIYFGAMSLTELSSCQSSHDSTIIDSEAIPSIPEYLCSVAYRYKTEAGDSGDKIALKFYPGDDPVETWAIVVAWTPRAIQSSIPR